MTKSLYTEFIDYTFVSKDKKAIQNFRDNLIEWSKYEFLKDKNGNFTCNIQDIFSSINLKNDYSCGYWNLDEESLKIRKKVIGGEDIFFLKIFIEDEEVRTSKLWRQVIEDYYKNKIDFGFIAVGVDNSFAVKYKPKILELISSNNDFWLYSRIEGYGSDKFKEFEFYDKGISNKKLRKLLSEILEKDVAEEEIRNTQKLEAIINLCNEKVKKADSYNVIDVVEIKEISLENLKWLYLEQERC